MTKAHDIELRRDVVEELEWDPSIDARTIGVAVEEHHRPDRTRGQLAADKTNAEKIVKRVHDVEGAANDLEVKLPTSLERDDVDVARAGGERARVERLGAEEPHQGQRQQGMGDARWRGRLVTRSARRKMPSMSSPEFAA
jgi:hypothetical protein